MAFSANCQGEKNPVRLNWRIVLHIPVCQEQRSAPVAILQIAFLPGVHAMVETLLKNWGAAKGLSIGLKYRLDSGDGSFIMKNIPLLLFDLSWKGKN